MGYGDFSFWYDDLNTDADYDRLAEKLTGILRANGVSGGLVVDLGCGTGELSIRLAGAGYDMIAVDSSSEMLSVFRCKLEGQASLLLLQQNLEDLDLYGTVRAAVSTFDTLNHLAPKTLETAIGRVALFMESGGVLVFDSNTPYKHEHVLGNSCFELLGNNGVSCQWDNRYDPAQKAVRFTITTMVDGKAVGTEAFTEYAYTLDEWTELLARHSFRLADVCDGESFGPLREDTERYLITAIREPRK